MRPRRGCSRSQAASSPPGGGWPSRSWTGWSSARAGRRRAGPPTCRWVCPPPTKTLPRLATSAWPTTTARPSSCASATGSSPRNCCGWRGAGRAGRADRRGHARPAGRGPGRRALRAGPLGRGRPSAPDAARNPGGAPAPHRRGGAADRRGARRRARVVEEEVASSAEAWLVEAEAEGVDPPKPPDRRIEA